jgi:glycosyltransferase involved in cell wall biosynthesis
MNLLVDCHVFDGKFQGTRTYLEGLYKEMVKHRDIEFYFAAQNIEGLERVFGKSGNIHYVRLEQEGRLARLVWEIPSLVKKLKIDYAHFQYITPLVKHCKEIVTIHDLLFLDLPEYFPLFYRIKNRTLFYRSAKRADVRLTVSEYSRRRIAAHFKMDPQKIWVTPNSVLPMEGDASMSNVCERMRLNKFILCVGRVEPRKNLLMVAKAFVELKLYQQGYQLVFVGSKDLNYHAFFAYLDGLPDEAKRQIRMESVPIEDLVTLYKHASLFVFPSVAEGFGIPPIEAVAYGCPLLCSNATAMAEFHLPEELYFDPHNLEELKGKMRAALDKPIYPIQIKQRLLKVFDWRKSADVLYKVLQEN